MTRDGQKIYVSDYNTHTIRLIDAGQVFTLAGTVFLSGSVDGVEPHPSIIRLDYL